MKKIELYTIVSGPNGTHHPGDIILVDDTEAAQLVAAHCARFVGKKEMPAAIAPQPEEAVAAPAENAGGRRKAKRKRRRGHDKQP